MGKVTLILLAPLLAVVYVPSAWAGLGGTADSVKNDSLLVKGSYRVREVSPRYTVHEIQSGQIQIREYVDNQGNVFAVTWHGGRPNLNVLLGDYFPRFDAAKTNAPRNRGARKRFEVHEGDLTVIQTGHMRTLGGIAFTKKFPEGVDPGSLQ